MQITYLITGFKDWEYIDYFLEVYKKIKGKSDFIFIFDNYPGKYWLEKIDKANIKYLNNFKNEGKFLKLFKVAKLIETPFFKTVDYDDLLVVEEMIKIESEISSVCQNNNWVDFSFCHKGAKVYKADVPENLFGKQTTDLKIVNLLLESSNDVNWHRVPNAASLYRTEILRKFGKINWVRQDYFDDDLLWTISITESKSKVVFLNSRPYIQFHGLGQTSVSNRKALPSVQKFYINLDKLANRFEVNFYDMLKSFKFSHEIWVKNQIKNNEKETRTKTILFKLTKSFSLKKDIYKRIDHLFSKMKYNHSIIIVDILDEDMFKVKKISDFLDKNHCTEFSNSIFLFKNWNNLSETQRKEINYIKKNNITSTFLTSQYVINDFLKKVDKSKEKIIFEKVYNLTFSNKTTFKRRPELENFSIEDLFKKISQDYLL